MADQSISELIRATQIQDTDLFLLEQGGDAKSLAGRVLLNWLTAAADGHGGIQSIAKLSSSGLTDTYRITLADTTTVDFTVTNGRGIRSIAKSGSSGLVDTYQVSYTDGSRSTFTVTNGAKGDKGDNAYTWIKYASQQPTAASHSMGDIPDAWMGIYTGTLAAAPTDWTQYKWYRVRGDQGATGAPATLTGRSVTYMASDSGTVVPSGSWSSDVPTVTQGRYLWTRVVLTFNSGSPVTYYSVSRFGIDGSGAVSSVNGKDPDPAGNVRVNAEDITTTAGTSVEAALAQKQEQLTAGAGVRISGSKISTAAAPRNLLDNSDFRNPVNQRGQTNYSLSAWGGYCIDRWAAYAAGANVTIGSGGLILSGCIHQPISSDVVSMYNGKVLTLAVKIAGTVYCCSGEVNQIGTWHPSARFDTPYGYINFETEDSNMMFVIIDNSTTPSVVEWAALYEGEYTAETLPEYQPKGYGAELLECQRYYYRRNLFCVLHPANKSNLSDYRGEITFPVEMRTNPQCAFDQDEGNVVTGPVNNQFCLLIGTPNESGWCTTGSRLEFIADL